MSKRINVMIDEDTWGFLGRIPAGERSRAINEALRAWATKRRRGDAAREMDALRAQLAERDPVEVGGRRARGEHTRSPPRASGDFQTHVHRGAAALSLSRLGSARCRA